MPFGVRVKRLIKVAQHSRKLVLSQKPMQLVLGFRQTNIKRQARSQLSALYGEAVRLQSAVQFLLAQVPWRRAFLLKLYVVAHERCGFFDNGVLNAGTVISSPIRASS
jgi:hypothetical protein